MEKGSVEVGSAFDLSDPEGRKLAEKAIQEDAEIRARMSPPGKIPAIPPLLERRRLEFGITDGAFDHQCAYDRILVHQLPRETGEKYEGTQIIMPETGKARRRADTPRGIVVSAGLRALDNLRSNGIDLGHIVSFIQMAPWRIKCDVFGAGRERYLLVLRDGDIIGSEDTRKAIAEGKCFINRRIDNGVATHVFTDENGDTWNPQMPWISDDY